MLILSWTELQVRAAHDSYFYNVQAHGTIYPQNFIKKTTSAVTLAQCAALCSQEETCQAFSFEAATTYYSLVAEPTDDVDLLSIGLTVDVLIH